MLSPNVSNAEIETLVLRMARENASWGYDRSRHWIGMCRLRNMKDNSDMLVPMTAVPRQKNV